MEAWHVVVLDVLGLSPRHFLRPELIPHLSGLLQRGRMVPLRPPFPCVTIPVQASLTTGTYPAEHGMVANGLYDRQRFEVSFWEQPSSLVERERIWEAARRQRPEMKTAVLFWQNTLYAHADVVLTPRPLHLESGLVPWCYSKPVGYYEEAARELGEFDLMSYWGPLASLKSSQWIADAAIYTLRRVQPHLLLVYLPQLDYSAQRFGPDSQAVEADLKAVDGLVGKILEAVEGMEWGRETAVVALSEYGFSAVRGALFPNRVLRDCGLLALREIRGKEYLDLEMSRAFALVDHQVAYIYVKPGYEAAARGALEGHEGIRWVMGEEEKRAHRVNHPRAGELIAVSQEDRWFAYPWWHDPEKAPEFARTVDIHRKPGYDPLELFFDPASHAISQDASLVKGSHGFPALGDDQMAALLVSGEGLELEEMRGPMESTDVAPLLAALLGIEWGIPGVE